MQTNGRWILMIVVLAALAVPLLAQEGVAPLPATDVYTLAEGEEALNAVYREVVNSVVSIAVAGPARGARSQLGTGSGFVIDDAGHIVTNNHVVANAEYVEVTFFDGTIAQATVIGLDPGADLAVIQVDPNDPLVDLQPVTFATSEGVRVGQGTLAIGSPFGEDFTLTTGIVSALNRTIPEVRGFSIPGAIQTDAAINPGNSGGPLLNMDGEVIGVNTAINTLSGAGSGIGFAIPSDTVRRIVPFLIADGSYEHSYLGISGTPLSPAQREAMDVPPEITGVVVASTVSDGPAERAGVAGARDAIETAFGRMPVDGDIITAINGTPINAMNDLVSYLEQFTRPGDSVTLTVWRDGEFVDLTVELQARPDLVNPLEES